MADLHSIEETLNSALISARRQAEQNERIIAMLNGVRALLDPEQDISAMTLLDVASEDVGDYENLYAITRALEALLGKTAEA